MDGSFSFGPSAVAAFVVFVGILIFVHELGHFLAAKYFDIKVVKFSLGFGPPLLAFRRGETQYQIAAIPLGGFVKMVGDSPIDDVAPEDRARAFTTAPIHQRAIIALAGPLFNLVFPILCFFAFNLFAATMTSPVVGQIEPGSPAERAGLVSGDRVLSVNGERTWSFDRMAQLVSAHPGEELSLEVRREGQLRVLKVTPIEDVREDVFGTPERHGLIGVSPERAGTRVGVEDSAKNVGGFVTGDRVLSFAGKPVIWVEELEAAVRANAGKTVDVVIARPEAVAAGDLLVATPERPATLQVSVPAEATGLASLGLANAESFVRGLLPGGAADRAGLRPGDRILTVNGRPLAFFYSFLRATMHAGKQPVELTVRRDGQDLKLSITGDEVTRKHEVTGKDRAYYDFGIGVGGLPRALSRWTTATPIEKEQVELSVGEAALVAVRQTGSVIGLVAIGLYKLFNRDISTDTVGGPIMLFQVAAQAAEMGFVSFLHMLALISVNLGLINLLPIPIFDGGHLMFCLVEAVKRRPISLRARERAQIIGLVLVVALFVLAMRNDILRLDLF